MEDQVQPSDGPGPQGTAPDGPDAQDGGSGLKGLRSLRRLRDRIHAVAAELTALRQENAVLQERIAELERSTRPSGDGGAPLALEGDPEALRRKVEGFILAIDRFLEEGAREG
jgi:hypothetical protein